MSELIVNPIFEKKIKHELEAEVCKFSMMGLGPGEIIRIKTKHSCPCYPLCEIPGRNKKMFKHKLLILEFTFSFAVELLKEDNLHRILNGLIQEYPFIGVKNG